MKSDLVGKRFGRLVVLEETGNRKRGNVIWKCVCDCGNIVYAPTAYITSGQKMSCGCLQKETNGKASITHNLSRHPAYASHKNAYSRCYDTESKFYFNYGGRGIRMSDEFIKSITAWCEYLGYPPDCEKKKWTVERIDSNENYERGNLKWATRKQQARNHNKASNNKTGVTGVCFTRSKPPAGAFLASWHDLFGKHHIRSFSVHKFGYEEAFKLAKAAREEAISKLNDLGAGYSDQHGVAKKVIEANE